MKIERQNTGSVASSIQIDLDNLNKVFDNLIEKNKIVSLLAEVLQGKLIKLEGLNDAEGGDENSIQILEEEKERLRGQINEIEHALLDAVLTEAGEENWSSDGVSLYFSL